MQAKRVIGAVVAGVLAASALAGCSGEQGAVPEEGATGGELMKVTYGSFPTNPVASIQYAINEGVFEAEGIDMEIVVGAGSSAAQLPALSTGELTFMLASPQTALTAQAQGLDIQIVSGVIENDPAVVEDAAAVIATAASGIKTAKDLSGKTVAVNALGSNGEISIREAVALDGGDPDTVNFVQLSFPEVNAQLEAGQIDAGMSVAPFMDSALADGGTLVSDFITEVGLGKNELVTIASGKTIAENPELIERYRAAWKQATELINENNDAVRQLIPEVLGTPEEVAQNVQLATHGYEVYPEVIQKFADLMVKYEIVDTAPDVNATIAK